MTKSYTELSLEAINDGYCVLTATQRLASHLENRWLKSKDSSLCSFSLEGASQLENSRVEAVQNGYSSGQDALVAEQISRGVVEAPPVYALSHWLKQYWSEAVFSMDSPPLILSSLQGIKKFEKIIRLSKEGQALLQIQKTAQEVYSAYGLCQAWNVNIGELESVSENVQVFKKWCSEFDDWCKEQGCLDQSKQLTYLQKHLEKSPCWPIGSPRKIYLAGFDDFPPNLASFLSVIAKSTQDAGIDAGLVHCEELKPMASSYEIFQFNRQEEEWHAMASFAKAAIDNTGSLPLRIAIVIPELTQHRSIIESIFMNTFHPERLFHPAASDPRTRIFNISRGLPLLDYALIKTAFALLKLSSLTLPMDRVQLILNSPFIIGGQSELAERATLLQQILMLRLPKIALTEFMSMAQFSCPLLYDALLALTERFKVIDKQASINSWRWQFCEWIAMMGWPGERNLSSIEYQTIMRWQSLLEEFASLDVVEDKPVSASKAISALAEIARACIFQPQSKDVPVQVLGVLEASGQCFDHIWISNVTSDTWPAPANPNPFLPTELQKRLAMPHASSERELDFATAILKRLSTSTPHFRVSYSTMAAGREIEPSPLLTQDLKQHHKINRVKDNYLKSLYQQSLELSKDKSNEMYSNTGTDVSSRIDVADGIESSVESFGPKVILAEESRGGASLLTYQSECPFKAFAMVRLGLKETEQPEPGLKAHERGQLVHYALEKFWNRVKNSQNLHSLSDSELEELIVLACQEAIAALRTPLSKIGHKVFWGIELTRLKNLLLSWIELEKNRPPFEVVAHEKKYVTKVGDLTLRVRLDRIDKINGSEDEVVIDYKTGVVSTNDWFLDRLSSPQLPLYATLSSKVKAAVFAELRPIDAKWQGVGAATYFDGIKSVDTIKITNKAVNKTTNTFNPSIESEPLTWTNVVDDWSSKIKGLADEFMQGYARVEPSHEKHCRMCPLSSACRFYHQEELS